MQNVECRIQNKNQTLHYSFFILHSVQEAHQRSPIILIAGLVAP